METKRSSLCDGHGPDVGTNDYRALERCRCQQQVLTCIFRPRGRRLSGDLSGLKGALASEGRCDNGHQPG